MRKIAMQIEELGRKEEYERVYQIAKQALNNKGDHKLVLRELKVVANRLRSRCRDLANNRATEFGKEIGEKTALLKKYNALTNEDMYGRSI